MGSLATKPIDRENRLVGGVQNLNVCDRAVRQVLRATEAVPFFRRQRVRQLAVATTQDADKVRPAAIDFLQADVERLVVVCFRFGHAPTQIDVHPMQRRCSYHCRSFGNTTLMR